MTMQILAVFLVCFVFGLAPVAFLNTHTNLKYKSDDLLAATLYSILVLVLTTLLEHVTQHVMARAFGPDQNLFCFVIFYFILGTIEEFVKLHLSFRLARTNRINILTAAVLIGCITGDLESLAYGVGTFDENSIGSVFDGYILRPFLHAAFCVLTVSLYFRISNRLPLASLIGSICVGCLHGLYNILAEHFLFCVVTVLCLIYTFFAIMQNDGRDDTTPNGVKLFYAAFMMISLISACLSPEPHMRILNMVPISSYSVFLLSGYLIRRAAMRIAAGR